MRFRTIVAAILLSGMMLANVGHSQIIVDSVNYRVALGDFSGLPGSIVKMPVMLKNAAAIGAFMIRVEYDASLLSPVAFGPEEVGSVFDSLELVDRGFYTIDVDSSGVMPPWDTSYSVWAFHNPGDDSINVDAMFLMFIPSLPPGDPTGWRRPHLPINTEDPSTILDLLFRVDLDALPGQTGTIYITDYVSDGQYTEYRKVQLTDTTAYMTIYPGAGPVFASGLFTVNTAYCGDADGNGVVDLLDITYLINYIYRDGPAPDPIEYADVNNSGNINILDVCYLIYYRYKNGPLPDCP